MITNWDTTLRGVLRQAREQKIALGHFNISDTEGLWAVFNAARVVGVPVLIGVSEGERDFIGIKQARALVSSLREEFNYPIFLNADHTYSFERVKEVVDAGYDSVVVDGSHLALAENIALVKESVVYARANHPEMLIEGELGYIGTSSKILDSVPEGVSLTRESMPTAEEVASFVSETGVDAIAPAVGNLHGMVRNTPNPHLFIDLIGDIAARTPVPLVLHGGSGITDDDFRAAIAAGISLIHINTEIRVAYRDGIAKTLADSPNEVAPYRFLAGGVEGMQKIVEARLRLFAGGA